MFKSKYLNYHDYVYVLEMLGSLSFPPSPNVCDGQSMVYNLLQSVKINCGMLKYELKNTHPCNLYTFHSFFSALRMGIYV